MKGSNIAHFRWLPITVLIISEILLPRPCIAADPPATAPSARTIYLLAGRPTTSDNPRGLLAFEMYRQAFLVAARDGFHLQTRDGNLREWTSGQAPSDSFEFIVNGGAVELLRHSRNDTKSVWKGSWEFDAWPAPTDWKSLAKTAEALSRLEFMDVLRQEGFSGDGNAIREAGLAPPDAETLVGNLDELSQFSVLRLTHGVIHDDGQSMARLGLIARAYANFGQLAQMQWSTESVVFAARAMLYAERMVSNDSKSALALWHRAYVRSLIGLQSLALDDLAEANLLKGTVAAPDWVQLLEPFCKYQPDELNKIALATRSVAPLARYLAFLALENSECQAAVMNFSQTALTANPSCLRLVEAMCEKTGPGMLNSLSEYGPQLYSRMLGDRLEKLPQMPQSLVDLLHRLKQPTNTNPARREEFCQALIAQGEPGTDGAEPSWAVLGRAIQEITFVQVRWRAQLIAEQWGVDASGYASEVSGLVADHPFKGVIAAYGFMHSDRSSAEAAVKDLPLEQVTIRFDPLRELAYEVAGDAASGEVYRAMLRNLDSTSNAIQRYINIYPEQDRPRSVSWAWNWLRSIDEESPEIIRAAIATAWNADNAVGWERDHGVYPSVSFALAERYAGLKQWSDAERCFKQYIGISPDQRGYQALADVYHAQNDEVEWLDTLNAFLRQTDYGLQHAGVQVEIARYYMDKGKYDKALPYATSASQTASAWGLSCAAAAYAGLGQWDEAEKLIVEEIDHYSESPFRWLAWCIRTGHGNRGRANTALREYLNDHKENASSEDLIQLAFLDIVEKRDDEAFEAFEKRRQQLAGSVSPLHIAILADELKKSDARDKALSSIPAHGGNQSKAIESFAALLRDAVEGGPDATLDQTKIDAIAKDAQPADRETILYLAGRYMDLHGDDKGATECYKRCIFGSYFYNIDLVLAENALRERGIDPLDLERKAVSGHEPNLEP